MLGAILSISFSLFGYVYVLTRASFFYQSQNLIEVSKNLGLSSKQSFFKIILPSARPAIIAGLSGNSESVFNTSSIFGFLAISLAAVNIFGGFLVTQRMLAMYKKKKKDKK